MPNRTELGDVPSTISPLQRALDELEASILDGKAAHRVLADALDNGIASPGAPPTRSEAHGHRADAHTLGERFEAVVAQIRYQMPASAVVARAADLLAMDEREASGEHPLTRSVDWVDAVRDFLRESVAGRMRPSKHTVTFVPSGVPGVLDGVPRDNAAVSEARAVLIDRILFAVFNTHDHSELWGHARRDPTAFRHAVQHVLDAHAKDVTRAAAPPWVANLEKEAATAVDPTQESVNRQVEHDLTVIAARMVRDYPGMPPRLNLGDLRRMANFVLAHSGEGPATPPSDTRRDQPAVERAVSAKRELAEQLFDAFWGTIVNAGWPMPVAWEALHESQRNAWRGVADAARRSLDQDLTFGAVVGGLGAAQLVYTAPAPKAEASPNLQAAIGEMDSGLNALVNELAPDVVQNLRTRFEDVLRHVNNQLLKPSHELEALRNFHENVTERLRSIRQLDSSTKRALGLARLEEDALTNNGQALMKPHQLDALGVTLKTSDTVVSSGTWTETPGLINSPQMPVAKRPDGAYTVGPPPDGRPLDEHLDELAAGKVTLAEIESAAGTTRTPEQRVIDIARRLVSRGIHRRRTLDEMLRGKDLNLLHNDLHGLIWLAEAVAALDKEKP